MAAKTDPPAFLGDMPAGAVDAVLRNDLASFAQMAFRVLKGAEPLLWARYLDVICAHLQDVALGKTSNLIITLPPRFLKSHCGSVALPAYFLGHNPNLEVMCVSYAADIARGFGESTRKLMASPEYKRVFETRLTSDRAAPHLLKTTQGGARRATSIDGAATALGANLLIFDDPQKAGETMSDAIRRSTNQAYENTFLSRQNDPLHQRTVIIMQRLHEDDFVGHVLSLGGNWTIIDLPAIAESDEVWPYDTFLGRHEWRRREGESLHPQRFPVAALQVRRAQSGEAIWAGQYQQRPAPAGGGLVKAAWFRRRVPEAMPQKFDRIVQSWDTANTIADWSDYSACTTWGILGDDIFLLNVYRARLLYPDLKRAIVEQASLFRATTVLIENRASGQQLLQELPKLGFQIAQAVDPERDKKMRMASQTAVIENGFVYIPEDAAWAAEYLHEMAVFPNGRFDDQVDSTSQFLIWHNNVRIAYWGLREFTRMEAERIEGLQPKEEIWVLRPPANFSTVQFLDIEGKPIRKDPDGLVRTNRETGIALMRTGNWSRVSDSE